MDHREVLHTAQHEAAHTVVQYRCSGFADSSVTIIPDADNQSLGSSLDCLTDSSNADDLRNRIVSCFAGGHADRKNGCYHAEHCEGDELAAAECIRLLQCDSEVPELRDTSRALTEKHWNEIEAVAAELVKRKTLDETEVEIIADLAAGDPDVSLRDLEMYRMLKRAG